MPKPIRTASTELSSSGLLQVNVVNIQNNFPIRNARVTITYSGEPTAPLEELSTNASGQTEEVSLAAPPLEYSLRPGEGQPYSDYNIMVEAPGFRPVTVEGTEVLPDATAIQPIRMEPETDTEPVENPIVIPEHTLYGNYPPKIAENEIQPVNESGEIVLSRVVVPQTIVVHDGPPTSNAENYYVPYRDYIKKWPPARSTPPGPRPPSQPMYWPS